MENQRIRLSKTMLKNALIRLLANKSIDKITVYELCAEAQINRTTFYKYYGNPRQLLDDIIQDIALDFEQALLADLSERSGTHKALEYLAADRVKIRTVLESVEEQELLNKIFAIPALQNTLAAFLSKPLTEAEKEYTKLFFYQGGYAIIRRWLDKGCPETPAQMAAPLAYVER